MLLVNERIVEVNDDNNSIIDYNTVVAASNHSWVYRWGFSASASASFLSVPPPWGWWETKTEYLMCTHNSRALVVFQVPSNGYTRGDEEILRGKRTLNLPTQRSVHHYQYIAIMRWPVNLV